MEGVKIMNLQTRSIQMSILIVTLITGIFVGTLGFAANNNYRNPNASSVPDYATNAYGETYGSDFHALTPDAVPDLILARGVDGTVGYVRNTDLNGEIPKTPQQALEQQRTRPKTRTIPLYDVDGRTVIGKFTIGNENDIIVEVSAK